MNNNILNSNQFGFDEGTYQKYHAYLYHFRKIKWSVFGTLTWAAASRRRETFDSETLRRVDFNQLLFKACGRLKMRRKHLWLYHCMEWGKAEECHLHFLISNRRSEGIFDTITDKLLAQTLQSIWTDEFRCFGSKRQGAGTARVVPYDEAKEFPAVKYCLKREWDRQGKERERFDCPSQNLLRFLMENPDGDNSPSEKFTFEPPCLKASEFETL